MKKGKDGFEELQRGLQKEQRRTRGKEGAMRDRQRVNGKEAAGTRMAFLYCFISPFI
jgi:hypothetical protein